MRKLTLLVDEFRTAEPMKSRVAVMTDSCDLSLLNTRMDCRINQSLTASCLRSTVSLIIAYTNPFFVCPRFVPTMRFDQPRHEGLFSQHLIADIYRPQLQLIARDTSRNCLQVRYRKSRNSLYDLVFIYSIFRVPLIIRAALDTETQDQHIASNTHRCYMAFASMIINCNECCK